MPLSVSLRQAAPIPLDVSLGCRPGELLALVGPSGSGKTTILRAIAGLYRPAAGCIRSGAETWFDAALGIMVPPQARHVGLVFQDYALFPHLAALDNVRLAMQHIPEPERRAKALDLLARVHLHGLEARTPDRLSGGQRQRVALARALARDPRVLLLDEPFSAVDRMTREPLKEELASLRRSLEVPIILVTHELEEAQALADRICVIEHGRTLQVGTPDEVRLRPVSVSVARLMGHPNVFAGELQARAEQGCAGRLRWGDAMLEVGATGEFAPGQSIAWLAPPDFIVLESSATGAGSAASNLLRGSVADIRPLGEWAALGVRVGEHALRLTISTRELSARGLAMGDAVTLRVLPEGIHLMARDAGV